MPSTQKLTKYLLSILLIVSCGFFQGTHAATLEKKPIIKKDVVKANVKEKFEQEKISSQNKKNKTDNSDQDALKKGKSTALGEEKDEDEDTENNQEKKTEELPKLKKPPVLEEVITTYHSATEMLDPLIVKQSKSVHQYVPFIRSVDFAINYSGFALEMINLGICGIRKKEKHYNHRYRGSFSVLFRKNIYLSSSLGYADIKPYLIKQLNQKESYKTFKEALEGKDKTEVVFEEKPAQRPYIVKGIQGSIGASCLLQGNRLDFIFGGQYSRSYFKGIIKDKQGSQKLNASWVSIIVGAEKKIFRNRNLYLGSSIGVKILATHSKIKNLALTSSDSAKENYHIPGYGRSVSQLLPIFGLYIKYKIILSKKYIAT